MDYALRSYSVMNKKALILSTLPFFALVLGAAVTIEKNNKGGFVIAEDQTYTLSMNEAPATLPTSVFGSASATYQTALGNPYPVTFAEAKADETFVTLADGGSIQAKIAGVKSVTVDFEGDLDLYGKVFEDEAFIKLGTLSDGTAFVLTDTVDYISILASDETQIGSIACTYSCVNSALEETTVRYEAEAALVYATDWNFESPKIVVWDEAKASGGKMTGNLWNGITYRIQHQAKVAGSHELELFYVNGTSGQSVTVSVNGQASFQVAVEPKVTGSWDIDNRTTVSTMVNLRAGYNDIFITCTGDAHAQYDCFDIHPIEDQEQYNPYAVPELATQADLFAIAAKTNNGCNRGTNWGAPYYAGCGMGLAENNSNYFVCDFDNMKAGDYKLFVEYGCDAERTLGFVINGDEENPVAATLPSSGAWNTLATNSNDIIVTFVEGTNTIKIPRPNGWFNINKISLSYVD